MTSSLGILVGTLEVWDWTVRDQVLVAELEFLKEMAGNVMGVLETWRRAGGRGVGDLENEEEVMDYGFEGMGLEDNKGLVRE